MSGGCLVRGFFAHAVKKSLVWLSVVVFLLAGGCSLRSEAPLSPRELAGRAEAVEWELVTRSGERASPGRVAVPGYPGLPVRGLLEALSPVS